MNIFSFTIEFIFSYFYRCGYGDASFAMYENMLHRPFMGRGSADKSMAEFHGRMIESIHGINSNINWTNSTIFQVHPSNFSEPSTTKVHELQDKFLSFGSYGSQVSLSQIDLHPSPQVKPSAQELMPITKPANSVEKTLKRKVSDIDLDLDLSLKLSSRNQESIEDHKVDSNLSLSLFSQSSTSSYLSRRLKETPDFSTEQRKKSASNALDLSI